MRLILVTDTPSSAWGPLDRRAPACLKPVAGRPLLHRLIEHWAERGIESIDVITANHPLLMRRVLGEGTRWGVVIRLHLARAAAGIENAVGRILESESDGSPVLVGDARMLPDIPPDALNAPVSFAHRGRALGWALVSPGGAVRTPTPPCEVGRLLDARTPAALLATNRMALRHEPDSPGLVAVADWGVFLAPGARVHADALLHAPVYVGSDTIIEAGAAIGPHAVIGSRCVVGAGTQLCRAVVGDAVAVGENLRLRHVAVEGDTLTEARGDGFSMQIADRNLIADLDSPRRRRPGFDRVAGLALCIATSPLLLLSATLLRLGRRGPVLRRRPVVALPAPESPAKVTTFPLVTFGVGARPPWRRSVCERLVMALRLDRLPALVHVARGELALRGVRPRSPSEFEALPAIWSAHYRTACAGWIDSATRVFGTAPTASESCASDLMTATRRARRGR